MTNISLYTLTAELERLLAIDDEDEFTAQLVEDVAGQIEAKSQNLCKAIKVLSATAESFEKEEKRIRDARIRLEKRSESIRTYMKEALLSAGIMKVNAGTFKVSVYPSQGQCVIDSEEAIPAEYKIVTISCDKTKVKNALKEGKEIAGARIVPGFSIKIT